MNFLEKLNLLMESHHLNKNTLSQMSGIPYTTIDGWYKKGYEGAKLSTIQKLAECFNTTIDYLMRPEITSMDYGKEKSPEPNRFEVSERERQVLLAYRAQPAMQPAVDRLLGLDTAPVIPDLAAATAQGVELVKEAMKNQQVPAKK